MTASLVRTPGGYRDAGLVHRVPAGTSIAHVDGKLHHLAADGSLLADYGPIPVRAAGRPLQPLNIGRHPDEELDPDTSILQGRPQPMDSVAPAFGSGWITYASWTNATGKPLTRFATTWTVPAAPETDNGQLLYLFNAIMNSTMIYQPVLQWGVSPAGGGPGWAVASWYVDGDSGPAFHSSLVPVKVGQVLTGVMTLTKVNGAKFSYESVFTGIAGSGFAVTDIEELTWCSQTLECYGITGPLDYPNAFDTRMVDIDIQCATVHPPVSWLVTNAVTDNGQHTVVTNNSSTSGEVDICYRASSLVSPIMPGHAEVTAVSRSARHLDVFCTDSSLSTLTAAWEPDFTDGWHGWWSLNGGRAAAGAPVHAVSRSTGKLDAFVVGTNKRIYTASWEPDFTDWWHGWSTILDGTAAPGSHVTAVSRAPDKLDIFVTGTNGGVYTASWQPGSTAWHGWSRIGTIVLPLGSMVGAVSRNTDYLDIFVTDVHGAIRTSSWNPASPGGWQPWMPINGGTAAPGSPVHPVSRNAGKIDIFVTGTNRGVYTASWQPGQALWDGWHRVGSLALPLGSHVNALTRSTDHLDVFATDVQGLISTTSWQPGATGWQGWSHINGGTASPGAPVTGVSSSPDFMDIFVVGTNSRVYTASWQPAFVDGWHGWRRMGA
ncbi:hypothetical protein acdb102_04830 [Acidothermaceae bacterium B102]|nr:hypothetical protein acdb102_04830 [Acidothermaceae bacterium B102]